MTMLRGSAVCAFLLLCLPAPAMSQQAEPDFSTPEAAVAAFIDGIAARDAEVVALSFSPQSAGEFEPLREMRLSDDDWAELQSMFDGATVLDTSVALDRADVAYVRVQLKEGEERLTMIEEDGRWWIVDF